MKPIIHVGLTLLGAIAGAGLGAQLGRLPFLAVDTAVACGAAAGLGIGFFLSEWLLIAIGSRKPRRPYGVVRTVPKESASQPFTERLAKFTRGDHDAPPVEAARPIITRRPMRFWARSNDHRPTPPRPQWFFARLLRQIRKLVRSNA